jgi:hypothetical protein
LCTEVCDPYRGKQYISTRQGEGGENRRRRREASSIKEGYEKGLKGEKIVFEVKSVTSLYKIGIYQG